MKILIKACANGNYGDDLFVLSILNRYADSLSADDEVVLLVYQMEKYAFLQEKYNNITLKLYPMPKLWRRVVNRVIPWGSVKDNLRKNAYEKAYCDITNTTYDAFINVGGSLLARFEGEKFVLSNWIELLLTYKIVAKRKYLLNINIQENIDDSFKKECVDIINKYDDVCFRDKISYEIFKNIDNCRMAPDIVFSMNDFFKENKIMYFKGSVLGINAINFNENKRLTKSRSTYVKKYEEMLIAISKEYLKKGYDIKLFAFDDRSEERDYMYYLKRKIIESNKENEEKISVVEYTFSNVEHFIKEFSCCTRLITTRFHAAISALLLNINFYPIVYDEKISNFFKTINFTNNYSTLDNLASISEIINSLEQKPNYCYSTIEQGDKVFRELDRFIEQGKL